MYIYVFGRVLTFWSTSVAQHIRFLLVSTVFLRITSLSGVLPLSSDSGFVRSLLVLSTFVLGGGGG